MTPTERLAAKIANERLKLFATLLNGLAVAALVGSLVAPFAAGSLIDPFWSLLVAGFGCLLHILGHLVLDVLKPEQWRMETIWLVPAALVVFGLVIFWAAWLVGRRFDRTYPHLSRRGMREAEQRDQAQRGAARRAQIPIPPFHPEEWRMRSARDEFESERLDQSLDFWAEQVARHPKPKSEHRTPARR